MGNAWNNVTEMSQFKGGRTRVGHTGSNALDECRELSTVSLSAALSAALQRAMVDLLEQAEKAYGYEIYQLYMEAMELSRDQRASIEAGFRTHYLQRFNRESRRERKRPSGVMDNGHLSLMEPADLETSLAATTLANAIHNTCSEALFGLDRRMGILINDPELRDGDNPLGPEVISAAVLDALIDQDAAIKVKLLLVSMLNKHLPERIRDIYQEVNQHLVKRGVLPSIRVGMKRSRPEGAGETPIAPAGQSGTVNHDLFATLQQLMSLGRIGSGPSMGGGGAHPAAAPGPAITSIIGVPSTLPVAGTQASAPIGGAFAPGGGLPTMASAGHSAGASNGQGAAEYGGVPVQGGNGLPAAPGGAPFLHTLTRLQHGDTELLRGASLDATRLGDGHSNVLRELKNSALANSMGQLDAMTLDIVAMVFDYILDDRRIPDAMKALIGRLQIPVLKVAMLDKAFFSQKGHPVRKLLDTLADASIGWNEEEGHDGGLYRKVDELVQFILNRFEEDIEVFVSAFDALQAFLVDEKTVVDERTGASAQVLHAREHAEIARIVAHDEVESHLVGQYAPGSIRTFLHDYWEVLLVTLYRDGGEDSKGWSEALETMRDLIWSVTPKVKPEERKRLVALLPKLLKRLDDGMKFMAVPDAERDTFFTSLVRCHAVAIRAGLHSGEADATSLDVGEASTEGSRVILPDPAMAEFEAITLPAVAVEPDPALLAEISAPAEVPEAKGIHDEPPSWADLQFEGDPNDRGDEIFRHLKRGTWIELRQEDGGTTRVKLSWISPLKGIYLFTNRLGKRAISINAEGLAAKCRAGKVSVIDNIPLVDRAVSNVLEKLQRNAAA